MLFVTPTLLASETVFFRSNGLGLPLEEIAPTMRDDYPYILERQDSGNRIEEILRRDGEVFRTSIYEFKGDMLYGRHYDGAEGRGELLRESVEVNGKLLEEKITEKHGREVRKYSWDGDMLESTEVISADGTRLVNRYVRGEEGQLLQVVRQDPDVKYGSDETVAEYQYFEEGRGINQWHIDPAGCTHFFFDDANSRVHEKYCDGKQTYSYREQRKDDRITLVENFPTERRKLVSVLDEKRQPLNSTETIGETVVRRYYRYEAGLLRELRVERGDIIEKTLYVYNDVSEAAGDPDAQAQGEMLYRNGTPVKEISYLEGESRKEVLYREGKPVVELLYDGEELVGTTSLIEEAPGGMGTKWD